MEREEALIGLPGDWGNGRSKRHALYALLGVVLLSCAMGMAQMAPSHPTTQGTPASPHGQMTVTETGGNPHGPGGSSFRTFASECGVTDLSQSRLTVVVSGADEKWRVVPATSTGDAKDVNVARAWRDADGRVRVIDISKSNATGDALQMSRACYSPKGSLRRVLEHYVNIPSCACGRETVSQFDEQGKQTKRTQEWFKMPSQEKMSAESAPKDAPAPIAYPTVSSLPFANLLKDKNASSH